MSEEHPMAATAFSEQLTNLLRPLVESNIALSVPLFANTLPLAYHLRCACAAQPRHSVRLVPWGADAIVGETSRAEFNQPIVFYCTPAQYASIGTELAREQRWSPRQYLPVTRYVPKYMFVRSTLRLQQALASAKVSQLPLNGELADHIKGKAGRCEVYSDTPEQALALRRYVKEALEIDVRIVDPMDPKELERPTRPHRALSLYYVSAPSATVMRRDATFVPLEIDSAALAAKVKKEQFETGVALIVPRESAMSEDVQKTVMGSLQSYHEALYSRVADAQNAERCANSFIELTWLYNRLAAARQRGDTFVSEDEYALCLSEHHAPPLSLEAS